MKLIYTNDKIDLVGKSIFLAGPTPRSPNVKSWRPEAIEQLVKLKFSGIVLVPETVNSVDFNFKDQVEWEWQGLENCSVIVFWVPRNLETMPAFTTNVEFGSHIRSGRAYYGRPDGSPKNDYLDWLYEKVTKRKPYSNLYELLMEAVTICK